jgi:hypothetical protein
MRCQCGNVALEVIGKPIMTVACYCDDCQQAAQKLSSLKNADPNSILEADGGTQFLMQRKDKIKCIKGAKFLSEYKLKQETSTRRVVARCCSTPMFLEFEKGHWLSLYMNRFKQVDQKPIEQRTMTKYKRADVHFGDNIPSPSSHTFSFMLKLALAWSAMKFQTPDIDYVQGEAIHLS